MTEIRNTTEDVKGPGGLLFLAEAMGSRDGGSGAILRQEAEGQRQLVNSDKLPTDMGGPGAQAEFEALGFTFGAEVPGDPLFRTATLPAGWTRQASDHSMHSHILDQHGRRRVGVFYKAAFYDRRADMRLVTPVGYLREVLHDGAAPVLDEVWLTPAVAAETLTALRDEAVDQAADCTRYAASASNPGYWTGREAELRTDAAKAEALLAALAEEVPCSPSS